MNRTFLVSNRLPVSVSVKDEQISFTRSTGGLATCLSSVYQHNQTVWVGWPGMDIPAEQEITAIRDALTQQQMHPVFISRDDLEKYYEGFSNDTIWPLFHYFPRLTSFSQENWDAYRKVNQQFCREILQVADEEDTIWIHDYHLFLLPCLIREQLPNISIGFFQHIPFPSYEVFRVLPWREAILRGILGADLIGFQTYDDSRHFLSSVSRILSVPNSNNFLEVGYRNVKVESFPISIDYDLYERTAKSSEVAQKAEEFRHSFGEKKIILSVDRLDLSKGIPEKLHAYERFMEIYPERNGTHNLILLVVPSRVDVENYKNLKSQIEQKVGRINGRFGNLTWTPIRYMFTSLPLESISALYKLADIALVTPLRDGMNLVAKEYLASKTDGTGVLIISEMAGASKELSDALMVNPFDINKVAEALQTAFEMPDQEQIRRNRQMQEQLKRNHVHRWSNSFLDKLKEVKQSQQIHSRKQMNPSVQNAILGAFLASRRKIMFLDYDGTLMPFFNDPRQAQPDGELLELMRKLASLPGNQVVIISGRDHYTLGKWCAGLPVDLIAEHGVWRRQAGGDWESIVHSDASWKHEFAPIFADFTDRTPGSFMEEKDFSIAWHYRKADPEFGLMRARELISNLEYRTTNQNLQLLDGNKVLELKSASYNKGIAASQWLQREPYDFILAIGDDYTDEDTFGRMPPDAFTIKVGPDKTIASYQIDTYRHARDFLNLLAESSGKTQPFPLGK